MGGTTQEMMRSVTGGNLQVLGSKKVAQENAQLVNGHFFFGTDPPVAEELLSLVDADHRVGVAHIHDDQHGPTSPEFKQVSKV